MAMLSRYRMLDLSRLLPGPYASHILADMGMDVIKVEEPEPRYGVPRDVLSPVTPTPEAEVKASAYNALARNKKSIALNLLREDLRPRSQEVFYKLVKQADVVLEGYRPGVVNWMGVDYETLRKHNPRIIMASISGYGQSGPYVKLPGHDPQYSAVGGMWTMEAGQPPRGTGMAVADLSAGMYAATAILGALLERESTGEGQYIDVPMLSSVMSLSLTEASRFLRDGPRPERRGGRRGAIFSVLECKDGKYISMSNVETTFWANFCRLIDREQYIPLQHADGEEYEAMAADVEGLFRTKDRAEWLPLLHAADTCAAPINTPAEAFDDPQVQHIGMAWSAEHPSEGTVRQLGFPARFSRTPAQFERFAPILGQHTREMLAEAGIGDREVAELEASGIVKSWTGDGWAGGLPAAEG